MAKSKLVKASKKIEEKVVSGYQKIEDGVVGGYKKIEDTFVGGYKKVEDKFVDNYLTKEDESVEDAKKRLAEERAERDAKAKEMTEGVEVSVVSAHTDRIVEMSMQQTAQVNAQARKMAGLE